MAHKTQEKHKRYNIAMNYWVAMITNKGTELQGNKATIKHRTPN